MSPEMILSAQFLQALSLMIGLIVIQTLDGVIQSLKIKFSSNLRRSSPAGAHDCFQLLMRVPVSLNVFAH